MWKPSETFCFPLEIEFGLNIGNVYVEGGNISHNLWQLTCKTVSHVQPAFRECTQKHTNSSAFTTCRGYSVEMVNHAEKYQWMYNNLLDAIDSCTFERTRDFLIIAFRSSNNSSHLNWKKCHVSIATVNVVSENLNRKFKNWARKKKTKKVWYVKDPKS